MNIDHPCSRSNSTKGGLFLSALLWHNFRAKVPFYLPCSYINYSLIAIKVAVVWIAMWGGLSHFTKQINSREKNTGIFVYLLQISLKNDII